MSGQGARQGFFFSDVVVAHRALSHLACKRQAEIEGSAPPGPLEFSLESAAGEDASPVWDVIERRGDPAASVVIEEIKSGPLKASDRASFWARIRETVAALDREGAVSVVPRLTTNAENPTDNPDYC